MNAIVCRLNEDESIMYTNEFPGNTLPMTLGRYYPKHNHVFTRGYCDGIFFVLDDPKPYYSFLEKEIASKENVVMGITFTETIKQRYLWNRTLYFIEFKKLSDSLQNLSHIDREYINKNIARICKKYGVDGI